jgi:hypothetical protein
MTLPAPRAKFVMMRNPTLEGIVKMERRDNGRERTPGGQVDTTIAAIESRSEAAKNGVVNP